MSNDKTNVTNIFSLVSNNDEPLQLEQPRVNTYYIETLDGDKFVRDGFLIFTAQHVAVMREINDNSSIPLLVMPLGLVKVVELIEDEDDLDDDEYIDVD
jgi:hypothetical protein